NPHPGRARVESDVEMMLPGQTVLRHVCDDAPDHAAKGVAHKEVITDVIDRHVRRLDDLAWRWRSACWQFACKSYVSHHLVSRKAGGVKVEASVARCLRTPPAAAK